MTTPPAESACPRCGSGNTGPARFCRRCGAELGGATGWTRRVPLHPAVSAWRQMSQRLTRKDVRRLLGEPVHVESQDISNPQARETWRYEYGSGETGRIHGQVEFLAADGRVLSWSEPEWPTG